MTDSSVPRPEAIVRGATEFRQFGAAVAGVVVASAAVAATRPARSMLRRAISQGYPGGSKGGARRDGE